MKQVQSIHRINELFANFVTQVKGLNSLNLYDINIISETILLPLFQEIFQLSNLKNVNEDRKNYPGIDLADDSKRVAFQVTATKTSNKINDTLYQFFKHNLDRRYDKLYCYILTEKQDSYTIASTELDKSDFDFKAERDILDYTDLLKRVKVFDIAKIDKIEKILEEQFAVTETIKRSRQDIIIEDPSSRKAKLINNEILCTNLLEITFPDKLYIAALDFDRIEVLKASRCEGGSYLKNTATMRQIAREALLQKGYRFANDWTCHANNLITFHDLYDKSNPLLNIIDEGTIEDLDTDNFFLIDSDYENVFRGLLHLCLIRFLYQKNVQWKHEDRVFVFLPETAELTKREIMWHGKVSAKRTVFEAYNKKKSEGISYCKHLAFKTSYRKYGEKWFIEIVPTWYISYDGSNKSRFGHERIKFLKILERNQSVFNHLKFITYFIKEKEQQMQMGESKPAPRGFLEFHELVKFTGHPNIDDNLWSTNEDKERQRRLSDPQQLLFSDF